MCLEARAREEGDNGRRRLLRTQAVVVTGVCHATADNLSVLAEAVGQASDGRDEKLACLVRLARVKEVQARVRAQGPVVVLA